MTQRVFLLSQHSDEVSSRGASTEVSGRPRLQPLQVWRFLRPPLWWDGCPVVLRCAVSACAIICGIFFKASHFLKSSKLSLVLSNGICKTRGRTCSTSFFLTCL